MVWLIALVPALFVYVYAVAAGTKSALFWGVICGVVVAAIGPPSYFLLDAGAVVVAALLAHVTPKEQPCEGVAPESAKADAEWRERLARSEHSRRRRRELGLVSSRVEVDGVKQAFKKTNDQGFGGG